MFEHVGISVGISVGYSMIFLFAYLTSTVADSRHIRRDEEVHTHQKTVLLPIASPKGGSSSSKWLKF